MELFLVIPVVVLVLVGGLQLVGVARSRLELAGAARDGARVAATSPDPRRAVEAALAALPPEIRPRARVTVTRPSLPGRQARVVVTVRHQLGTPFPPGVGFDLSAAAAMTVER
ncbi:MAG: pilus assembly protein [Acidimicrobiales bacterium]|nr:pilus assembly protein [Acidimicrobiales bacterium]